VQVEIDEYRDYDKALGALKESRKFMLKAEQDCTVLDRRIEMVDIFVRAKAMVKTEPDQFLKICHDLLNQPKLDAAVQVPRAAATTTRSWANRTGHAHARGAGQSMCFVSRSALTAPPPCLQVGDVFALLVEFHTSQGDFDQARPRPRARKRYGS
jgi:hypothetical protein